MLRVLIADDHDLIRRGVRKLIEAHGGWAVCGEASNGQEALDLALRERPDIAVLDISMPLVDGLGVAHRLRQERPKTAVLIYTMHDDDEMIRGGLAAGARGYLLKSDSAINLEAAISALGSRRTYFSSVVSEFLLEAALNNRMQSRSERLTLRELEVAQLMAEGLSNKDMARKLGRSIKTVERHRSSAMCKAGVHQAGQFVRFALKHHLIPA